MAPKVGETVFSKSPEQTQVKSGGTNRGLLDAAREAWRPKQTGQATEVEKKAFTNKMAALDTQLHQKNGPLANHPNLHVIGFERNGNPIVGEYDKSKGQKHATHQYVIDAKTGKIVKQAACDQSGKAGQWETEKRPSTSTRPPSERAGSYDSNFRAAGGKNTFQESQDGDKAHPTRISIPDADNTQFVRRVVKGVPQGDYEMYLKGQKQEGTYTIERGSDGSVTYYRVDKGWTTKLGPDGKVIAS